MERNSLVEVHCGAISSAPLLGKLTLISSEGFYEVKLEIDGKFRIAHFPIAGTILIAATEAGLARKGDS